MSSQYHLSEWEKFAYYHGVSADPPELLYRSDYLETPFPRPTGWIQRISPKSVRGVFNTPLNPVWHTVAPLIRDGLKARKIRYSAIQAARFVTHGENGQDTLGPVVIWIAVFPASTTAEDAHLASPDILALLEDHGVHGAVVEWFEGAVEELSGPRLLKVTDDDDPTYYVRRFLTAALGMPIAIAEREDEDAQGSVAFFFHENKDKCGKPSARVFAVSNCHVLRKDTTVPYQFEGAGAPPQHVRLAGFRRFQRGLDEIQHTIAGYRAEVKILPQQIAAKEAKLRSEDIAEAQQARKTMDEKRARLAKLKEHIAALEVFYNDVVAQWGDIARRTIGRVDWAPEISVDTEGRRYTKDIGTFELDAERFRAHFKGNVVDLGAKYTASELIAKFYPRDDQQTGFEFPFSHQFRINGWLTPELLEHPDTDGGNDDPRIIVMKDGSTSDLTVGQTSGLEAYTSTRLGVESMEVAIYNYDNKQPSPFDNKPSTTFAHKGDSGSLVFDGKGRMVGLLHSGLVRGGVVDVAFATPAWWVVEQIKLQYPHADFSRDEF